MKLKKIFLLRESDHGGDDIPGEPQLPAAPQPSLDLFKAGLSSFVDQVLDRSREFERQLQGLTETADDDQRKELGAIHKVMADFLKNGGKLAAELAKLNQAELEAEPAQAFDGGVPANPGPGRPPSNGKTFQKR